MTETVPAQELALEANPPENAAKASAPNTALVRLRPARAWLCVVAACVALISLALPIASIGIWDPPELRVAEFARRLAINLYGAASLAIEGADNTIPIKADLGRGELPFTSIALGLRLFGLHDWAGRLPLVVWGLLGLFASYALVARLSDRVAAAITVIALSTMPLYFLHARTMLGDIVTMSSLAIAAAGLGIATFDYGAGGLKLVWRLLLWMLGALGLFAGFWCRGALIGVAVPALGVGLTWLVLRCSARKGELASDLFGGVSLFVGAVAAFVASRALLSAEENPSLYSIVIGSSVNPARVLPTFDAVILQLGHALFPWSALFPVAVGRALSVPAEIPEEMRERELALRVLSLVICAVALAAFGFAAPLIGVPPFSAPAMIAILIALMLRDFERGADPSRALTMTVIALAILLLTDFKNFPEKGLSAFVVSEARFPESFKPAADAILQLGTLGFAFVFFFALLERESVPRFQRSEYEAWPNILRTLWNGNVQFVLLVLEAALIGLVVLGYFSERYFSLTQFERMGAPTRTLALYGALALPALVVSPLAAMAVRDAFRSLFTPAFGSRKLGELFPKWQSTAPSRPIVALLSVAAFGLILSLGYYPALAKQISPKQIFESYKTLSRQGEELGMIGTGSGSASYYAGQNVPTFAAVPSAFEWLMAEKGRRFLIIRSTDLASMNSQYRGRLEPPKNLPVLDARSSEILLVSNQLRPGEENTNPLAPFVLSEPPRPAHLLEVNLGDKLEVLGWDVRSLDNVPVRAVEPGREYDFNIYFKVVAPISGAWQTFIHIDGFQRRFNGDHPTLAGKYPFSVWRVGDYLVDRHRIALEPNFTPGTYRVYFGLFSGSRRLDVRRGRHDDNRVEAGGLVVK